MGIAQTHGAAGERLAAAYFELIGGAVVGRNLRLAGVEVDLLVEENGAQVLVEVKTRTRADYGGAALAVDRAKRARLVRASAALDPARARRIDVIAIETSESGATLRHYRGAIGGG
jgi:putative endonuclease